MGSLEEQLDYARDLCQQGKFIEGKEIYLKIHEVDPNNFRILANLGAIELNDKNYEMSACYLQKAVNINSMQPLIHYNLGRALHELKDYSNAIIHYQTAIKIYPDFAEAYLNYGLTLSSQGDYSLAIEQYDKAIRLKPDYSDAYSNRGVALSALENYDDALADYRSAIQLNANNAEAYNNLGAVLHQLKRYDEAIENYDKAIQLNPTYAKAYANRGLAFNNLGQYEIALPDYEKAIQLDSGNAESYNNLGVAHYQLRHHKEALANYDNAIKLKSDYAEAYSNRGLCFNDLRQYKEALSDYEKSIQLKPDNILAYNNFGLSLYRLGRYDEALAAYDKAIQLSPDQALGYWNKSLVKLLTGDFEEGWKLYERRWEKEGFEERRHANIPSWTGEQDLKGKSLLIWSEQGQGDIIQFSRYALLARNRGALVTFEVPKSLVSSLSTMSHDINVIQEGIPLTSQFDFQIPVMSLPPAFNTTLKTVPSAIPYIHPDLDKVTLWKKRLGIKNKLCVGLVWSGSTIHSNDLNRSIPLDALLPLMELPIEFHSLQIHYKEADLKVLDSTSRVIRHELELKDFSDTAALIENMDIVLTVDTSVAHLAGALGKSTWIMLPYSPDFRWMLNRDDTPWYPTANLFRQAQMFDWSNVIDQVRDKLQKY